MAMNAQQSIVPGLQYRQLGILSPNNFSRGTSGSCGLVKRLTLHENLEHHDGCVNTLHFNMSGELLASGSDDLDIVIWDWAKGKKKLAYESGHSSNVFQVKDRSHEKKPELLWVVTGKFISRTCLSRGRLKDVIIKSQ